MPYPKYASSGRLNYNLGKSKMANWQSKFINRTDCNCCDISQTELHHAK